MRCGEDREFYTDEEGIGIYAKFNGRLCRLVIEVQPSLVQPDVHCRWEICSADPLRCLQQLRPKHLKKCINQGRL